MSDQPLVLSPDGIRLVMVHRHVIDTIASRAERRHSTLEAGGILLGAYRGDHIEILSCTEPMKADFRTRVLFDRKDPGHQAAAMSAWRESGGTDTFVGEWHTHPEAVPRPSWLDMTTWRCQMKRVELPLVFAIGGWSGFYWGIGDTGRVSEMTPLP